MLFYMQAARTVLAILIGSTTRALANGRVDALLASSHLVLLLVLAIPWLAPRQRTALPRTLMINAIAVGICRVALSIPIQQVELFAGLFAIGISGLYLSLLLRANRRTWVHIVVIGLVLEQLLRAADSYDPTLQTLTNIAIGEFRLRMPVVVLQLAITGALIYASVRARSATRFEPYDPGLLTTSGGIAYGSFLALEFMVLGLPNVVARWSNIPYQTIVPLISLATTIALLPAVRDFVWQTLGTFDERLRGWVWIFILLLLLIVGNRLVGLGAATALILAQFMLVMLVWWIPTAPDSDEVEQVGPSVSIGLFVFVVLVYAYSLTFEDVFAPRFLQNQALTIVLVAGALAGIPRLFWREVDPWAEKITIPRSLPAAFVAPVVLCGLLLGSITARSAQELGNTLRIATYNINNGYDENGVFQLDATARTIEASVADVILIQQVDTGRPSSYGIDEMEYLARRLGMYQVYLSASEHLEGVGVLSRWPITNQHGITLSGEGALSAVRVRISDIESNRTLDVVSADFRTAQNEARLQQLAYFFNFLDREIPTVAGLDLGSGPEDMAYQQLTSVSFDDPDKTLGIERGYTYPATNPTERRDYLLVRGLVASETRQVKSEASSHRLVVVELHWP